MKHFTLIVTKSPFDSRNAETAIAFCRAAFLRGDIVDQVFFYQSGVHNASALLQANSDEYNVKMAWETLAKMYKVPLNVCVTASARRGVVNDELVSNKQVANLQAPFIQVGLADYFAALARGSINVQF